MKEMYKSPVITVEELQKADVLCISAENIFAGSAGKADNRTGSYSLLNEAGDLTNLL